MSTLSNQDQLRYVIEWFQEWSEMQRADFLEILAERCGSPSTVNGLSSLVDGLSCKEESNRPPSLFQCRVKLFHEWSQNWSQQEKDGLVVSIKNMDPKFAEKYDQREVELSDRKTFVITAGEDNDEEDEDSENEMIQPEDLVVFGSLVDDEERYRPLHSHVEHYNRRAAESAAQSSGTLSHFQPNLEKISLVDEEEPFIAGFKNELDEYDFDRSVEVEVVSPRRKRHDSGERSPNVLLIRSKKDDEDILGSTEESGDLVETMRSRNHSMLQGEYAGHATPHPGDSTDTTMDSETHQTEDYAEEHTSISYEHPAAGELDKSGRKESAHHGFFDSQVDTTEASLEEAEEDAYDYENFRAEYDQQVENAKSSNMTFNYTDNGEPEETAKDAIKKIVEFDMPKNCTKEELTQFGVKALECLAFDYRNARNQSDVRRILARTWTVVRIWICIYVCIAVPCWFQKGWCCCCFCCSMCFPEDRILEAKHYYAQNPPGLLVDQPQKKGEVPEPTKYKPTLFEIDAYENFESAIRNL